MGEREGGRERKGMGEEKGKMGKDREVGREGGWWDRERKEERNPATGWGLVRPK